MTKSNLLHPVLLDAWDVVGFLTQLIISSPSVMVNFDCQFEWIKNLPKELVPHIFGCLCEGISRYYQLKRRDVC